MSPRYFTLPLVGALGMLLACPPKNDTPKPKPDVGGPAEPSKPAQEPDPALLEIVKERFAAAEQRRAALVGAQPFAPMHALRFPGTFEPGVCVAPPPAPAIDEHRSLFVHDRATLNHVGTTHSFSLEHTFEQLATQITNAGVTGVTAETLFRDFWDTQNQAAAAATPAGAHCNDDGGTINGFPNSCPRAEGQQAHNAANNLDNYSPIAVVNRLDLASEGWRNCGEHRIVYAKTAGPGRNLMIFEAVLPNPSPGCQDGCRPVAEFWGELSTDPSATSRAEKLLSFYYDGLPGFRPVVHVGHYSSTGASSGYGSAGGGQIRTNQFMQSPWTLKEMRTLIDCGSGTCEFQFVPDTVKLNPFGELWDPNLPATDFNNRVGMFRAAISTQVAALGGASDVNSLSYELLNDFNGAQSDAQSPNGDSAYCTHFNCNSDDYLGSALATFNASQPPGNQLTAEHVVNRATALSCGGCHQPSTFGLNVPGALGPSGSGLQSWPASAGFVHTNEDVQVAMHTPSLFGNDTGFALSPALENEFLPARQANLEAFLAKDDCTCVPAFVPRLPREFFERFRGLVSPPPVEIPGLRRSLVLRELDRKLEKLAVELGTEAGIKPKARTPVSLVPAVEKLEVSKGIEDPAKRAAARSQAIRERIAAEPPLRTVNGSFKVH